MVVRIHQAAFSLLLLAGVAAVAGCGKAEPQAGDTVKREGEPPIVYVEDDDPKMAAAIDNARSTVDRFIQNLEKPKPSQSGFSVKLPVKDGDNVEHMWVLPVRYENGTFSGTINNEPDKVKTVKIGDQVKVAKDQISDWMFVDDGKLMGGYTIRVLRDSMPEQERHEFDESVPFTFD